MPKDGPIPDAWDDDDWEAKADLAAKERTRAPAQPPPEPPMTRAERLARHAEEQRKLWESADSADPTPFILPPTNPIPFSTAFKPPVKVLSRKPTPQILAKRDPTTGLEQLTLDDDKDDDGASQVKKQETAEDIRRRLEEKQRRYEEARAKIFGDSSPSSGQSTPRTGTPGTGGGSEGRQNYRGRGRGRGRGGRDQDNGRQDRRSHGNQQQPPGGTRELFDPGYSPKPGFPLQKRGDRAGQPGGRGNAPREEDQVIRAPRGPDGTGRGFGLVRRGGSQG
ncbi:hypothetical protein VTJ83DRAFT_633 [Remersonia thermophila]|uniref:SUZ domain-containing protein n=1 Tax=Remersonia thermophila TaxID=72144 RepID=A0ABR4DN99_9PEZI